MDGAGERLLIFTVFLLLLFAGGQWLKEWLAGELFENLPCDGLVVKVNSGNTKKRLGVTSKCPNWAIALKK